MIIGEYEGLRAMNAVSPELVPKPYACGHYKSVENKDTYFLLAEFRLVGEQPPDPVCFTAKLAELHKKSESPTKMFGFHTTSCHGTVPLMTNIWEKSWEEMYRKLLGAVIKLDEEKHGKWPEFKILCDLVLDQVITRLLRPLQSDGNDIKPCLVHGDL
jgi:protein-ribulosamine 3-kinase